MGVGLDLTGNIYIANKYLLALPAVANCFLIQITHAASNKFPGPLFQNGFYSLPSVKPIKAYSRLKKVFFFLHFFLSQRNKWISTVHIRSASFPSFLKIKIASQAAYTEGALSNILSAFFVNMKRQYHFIYSCAFYATLSVFFKSGLVLSITCTAPITQVLIIIDNFRSLLYFVS